MAWIESHETLGEHPKVYEFITLLKIDKPTAVGILHLIWHFTLKFAWRDGDLNRFSKEAISFAIGWNGDPEKLFSALQESGWLDNMVVHDWIDYAGKLLRDRLYNEKRRNTTLNVVSRRKTVATLPYSTLQKSIREEKKKRREEYSAELLKIAPAPPPDSFLIFPTNGKIKSWPLTIKRLNELKELYPGINCELELRKACDWCKREPTKRKTARGMERFLNTWLSKAQDRNGSKSFNGHQKENVNV